MERLRYKLDLVTAPVIEPITKTEIKNALRIDNNVDDNFIDALITAARISAESYTGRAFNTQTWNMYFDTFPYDTTTIEIPKPMLQSVTSIKTYDDSDNATVFASSNYYTATYQGDFARCGTVTLRSDSVFPIVYRVKDGVEIQYVAGYGDDACDVPQPIRMALLEEVLFLYENRGCCDGGFNSGIAKALLNPFRILKI